MSQVEVGSLGTLSVSMNCENNIMFQMWYHPAVQGCRPKMAKSNQNSSLCVCDCVSVWVQSQSQRNECEYCDQGWCVRIGHSLMTSWKLRAVLPSARGNENGKGAWHSALYFIHKCAPIFWRFRRQFNSDFRYFDRFGLGLMRGLIWYPFFMFKRILLTFKGVNQITPFPWFLCV